MPANLTTQHAPLPLDVLLELRDSLTVGTAVNPRLETALRGLVQAHPLLNYTWESGHTFWRGRLRNPSERHTTLKDMLWPPTDRAGLGRSNLVGEPILYLSDHLSTAVTELSDDRGEPMQFIALEIRHTETMRFVPIGEMSEIVATGRSLVTPDPERAKIILGVLDACPPQDARRLILTDRLIFDAYSAPGRHEAASIIANEMRRKLPESDGVMYQSTKKAGALNIAMRPSSFLSKCHVVAGLTADFCAIGDAGKCRIEGIEPIVAVDERGTFIWSGVKQAHTQFPAFPTRANHDHISAP